jgi:hypothetical protein
VHIYTSFPSGWWGLLTVIYGIYGGAYLLRKKKKKLEVFSQIRFGLVTLLICFSLEFVGVSLGLWNYVPGNWPVILWFGYFSLGLAGYQISKKLEESEK